MLENQYLERLKNLIKDVKPQGLIKRLKTNNELYTLLLFIKQKYRHDTLNETIYCILNNIEEKPKCQNCNGQNGNIKFTSIIEGYRIYCWKCGCIENMRKSIKEKYGVDNIAKLKEIQEKKKKTCLDKWGVESTNQLQSVKEKKKKTLFENFGSEGLANPIIKEKRKQTSLEKYGEEHPTKTKEVQDKKKETCLERYGVNNVMFVDSIKKKVSDSWYNNRNFEDYVKKLVDLRDYNLLSEYTSSHERIVIQCRKCQTSFDIIWNDFQQGGGLCPKCYPLNMGFSKPEEDIINFLSRNNITNLDRRNQKLIHPFEIDIVDHSRKIAIEYCGLWFHSSGENSLSNHPKTYHLKKLDMCQNIGYRLITIFEDEWILKQDIVKSKLLLLFGAISNFHKIYARNCFIKEIKYDDKKNFLDNYHLQNDRVSTINIGAFFENQLLSVMTFLHCDNDVWELTRYCCHPSYIIPGVFSKLLNYFKNNYRFTRIETYADKRWSAGDVYIKTGFEKVCDTDPNYWYWGKGIKGRSHRLNFMKEKLKLLPFYDDKLTEFQIMALNKYCWIYDCGNIKFQLVKLI